MELRTTKLNTVASHLRVFMTLQHMLDMGYL